MLNHPCQLAKEREIGRLRKGPRRYIIAYAARPQAVDTKERPRTKGQRLKDLALLVGHGVAHGNDPNLLQLLVEAAHDFDAEPTI